MKALCRQDSMAVNSTKMKAFRRLPFVTTMRADLNKMVDTMRHIFKVHFFFCLLASRAPWFECSVSRFSSYTCKERYHKPLGSCLGWEGSKEKKKKKGKEKKRKEKKRNVKDRLRGKNSRKTEKFPWGMGQSKDLERKRESEREGEREERERRERENSLKQTKKNQKQKKKHTLTEHLAHSDLSPLRKFISPIAHHWKKNIHLGNGGSAFLYSQFSALRSGETEAGRLLWVWGYLVLQCEFQDRQMTDTEKPCLEKEVCLGGRGRGRGS